MCSTSSLSRSPARLNAVTFGIVFGLKAGCYAIFRNWGRRFRYQPKRFVTRAPTMNCENAPVRPFLMYLRLVPFQKSKGIQVYSLAFGSGSITPVFRGGRSFTSVMQKALYKSATNPNCKSLLVQPLKGYIESVSRSPCEGVTPLARTR